MKTIPCLLSQAARRSPHRIAVINHDEIISYARLDALVERARHTLGGLGVKKNTRVSILSVNSLPYIVLLLALWRLKAIACLLSARLPHAEIIRQLKMINSEILFASMDGADRQDIPAVIFNMDVIMTGKRGQLPFRHKRELTPFSLHQPATIIFTSGTTGTPKAVLHSIGNHLYSAKGSNDNIPVEPGDRWLLSLPLYHVGGLSILFRILLGRGTLVIVPSTRDVARPLDQY